jgi:O-antigen ligase
MSTRSIAVSSTWLLRCHAIADWLAIAVAASLPWSTSASSILIVLWLLSLLLALDIAALRRELLTVAGGLPVLLWLFAAVGMLWADVSWADRLAALSGFHKLLVIPLLLVQFRGSTRGALVFWAFLLSCVVLLATSYVLALWPDLSWRGKVGTPGVPVKDYVAQSGEFVICFFSLLPLALRFIRVRPQYGLIILATATLFFANILYVATGRTALVVAVVFVFLFASRYFGWKGVCGVLSAGILLTFLIWTSSPNFRAQINLIPGEYQQYSNTNARTRIGERIEFWRKSISFITEAPIFGHGTGEIRRLFGLAASGQAGASALVPDNPHNQTLTIGIQLGLVGVVLLYAMWIGHVWLFRGPTLPAWIGLVIVVQNIISSSFNSHLFDFTQGWLYVFGVGAAGGVVQQLKDAIPKSELTTSYSHERLPTTQERDRGAYDQSRVLKSQVFVGQDLERGELGTSPAIMD